MEYSKRHNVNVQFIYSSYAKWYGYALSTSMNIGSSPIVVITLRMPLTAH